MIRLTEVDLAEILAVHIEDTRVSTHGETCHLWGRHRNCAIVRLVEEVRRLRARNERLEVVRLCASEAHTERCLNGGGGTEEDERLRAALADCVTQPTVTTQP